MMLCGLVCAQDLEDDFLKISAKDINTIEEDYSEEEEALDDILSTYDISEKRVKSKSLGNQELVAAKREQLGIVVRRAYYQKLTAPKWASVISSDSWRDSFLKWRYYAQLRNYIANIDNDLTYFKVNKPIVALVPQEALTTAMKPVIVGEIEEELIVSEKDGVGVEEDITTDDIEEVITPVDIQETSETSIATIIEKNDENIAVAQPLIAEEEWETQGENVEEVEVVEELAEETPFVSEEVKVEEIKEEVISFSLDQLTLPDDMVSERETYETLLAARLDSIAIAEEEVLASKLLDETLAARELKKKRTPDPITEKKKLDTSNKKEESKKEERKKIAAVVKKTESAPSQRIVISAPTPQESTVFNSSSNTYTPDRSTNRTVTAASVAPSTAPRTISAGRQAQTAGFVKRKGKLSWPVMSGEVTDQYGIRANAAARGLKPRNNGVDMSCPTSTSVLSVHSGTVMMVAKQAPYDHIITVKHGDYTSAYYYINSPSVNVGDVVAMGQRLGRLIGGDGEAMFHFELWEGQNKVNPEIWLSPK